MLDNLIAGKCDNMLERERESSGRGRGVNWGVREVSVVMRVVVGRSWVGRG